MKKRFIKVTFFLFLMFVLPKAISAATFSVTKSDDNIKPGGTFQVIVNVSDLDDTTSTLYGYNLVLEYDNSVLEFQGDAGSDKSDIANNGNKVSINSKQWDPQTSSFEVAKFNMKVSDGAGSGSSNLGLSGSCNLNGETGTCNYNGSSVTVASLGTDASLSSLSIPNTTITPGFSSDVTDYKATVQDVTEITVNASANDPNAKISITDNYKNLQKGDNKIDIVVESEDGNNKQTYTVVVTLNVTPTAEELKKADATLKSLTIKNQKIEFDPTEKKYYLTVESTVNDLSITAVPTNEKAKVEIEGNKKFVIGKNTVKINVTSEDGTKKETYQLIVTKKEADKEINQTCPTLNNISNWTAFVWILFSVLALVMFSLGIFLGYILCKKDVLSKIFKKKAKKEEVPVEIETLSDTIDLGETLKEIKDKKKKD